MRLHIRARKSVLLAAILVFAAAAGAGGQVIYVKWDSPQNGPGTNWGNAYHTIQQGITAVSWEDVWVARGTYGEQVTLKSDIQVFGGFVGNETDIGQRQGFPRSQPDPNASIIDPGGSGRCVLIPENAGVHTAIDGFTIQNGDSGGNHGGAIRCEEGGSARIINNLIRDNAADSCAAGIYVYKCTPTISDNVFTNNDVVSTDCPGWKKGGAIRCYECPAFVISGNVFESNSAPEGGAIAVVYSSPYISGNTFLYNTADCRGGAIQLDDSTGTILGNTFNGNTAVGVAGGAIYLGGGSSPVIQNNLMINNTALGPGGAGAILCWNSSPAILNNTIAGSSPEGIRLRNSTSHINNNIIVYNDVGIRDEVGSTPTLHNNNVCGNTSADYVGVTPGPADIYVDPLFLNYAGGDLHLSSGSGCINAGYDDPIGLPVCDMDGQARVNEGIVDIGADEYWSKVIHVSQEPTSSDTNSGETWGTAKRTIGGALSAAGLLDRIWVAHGTYSERISPQPSIELYGGFAGSETLLEERPTFPRSIPDPNATVIDGSSGGTVVTFQPDATPYTKLDGFTIAHGDAVLGGGINCTASSPSITNSMFYQNFAHEGGAIYLEAASPSIEWCRFRQNVALYNGGAIHAYYYCSPTIRCCLIRDCETLNTDGGGVYIDGGAPRIVGSIITDCTASAKGGGIRCEASDAILTNNTIVDNTAADGGGVAMTGGSPRLYNNIVAFNSSGIYGDGGVTPELFTNDLWQNGGLNYSGVTPGASDISVDPKFAALDYQDYHLRSQSGCIDAGANTGPYIPDTDMDRQHRPYYDMDIGADEWHPYEVYYVTTDGDDSRDGLSWSQSLRTINAALDKCIWENHVHIEAGTYNEHITIPLGVDIGGGYNGETIIHADGEGSIVHCQPGLDDVGRLSYVTLLDGNATYGGGINCTDASPMVWGVTIIGCQADEGGGIYINNGSPHIQDCNIWENQAVNRGGGIHCSGTSSPLIRRNNISGNQTVTGDGGGVFLSGGTPIVHANTIKSNEAALAGGGIRCWNSSAELRSNVIWSNPAQYGAGVHIHNGDVIVANNTITDNWVRTGGFGGGIDADGAQGHIFNNIVAFNSAGIFVDGGTLTFDHNNVYGNFAYNYSGTSPGPGDMSEPSQFVNRLQGDCRLLPASPCINAGYEDGSSPTYSDFEGEPRNQGGAVDIGADEVQAVAGLSGVRTATTGSPVHIYGVVATACFADCFYVELPSRANGIRVETAYPSVAIGDDMGVWGRVWVNDQGERYIEPEMYVAVASEALGPLAMSNHCLGGAGVLATDGTPAQEGVKGGEGQNTIGLLVRTFGQVTAVGADWFYVEDGSGLQDGSGNPGAKVWIRGFMPPEVQLDDVVAVTGVCSCYKIGENLFPVVVPRTSADIQIVEQE